VRGCEANDASDIAIAIANSIALVIMLLFTAIVADGQCTTQKYRKRENSMFLSF
jgi:hypothetical protein